MPWIGKGYPELQPSEFIAHVVDPTQLRSSHLGELEKIREKYPWFAASHLILCRAHKNENRFSYQALLKKSALHSANREQLYAFMNLEKKTLIEPSQDKTDKQTTKQPNNRTTEQPDNQKTRTIEQPDKQTTEQQDKQATVEPENQKTRTIEKPDNRTTEQPDNRTTEQPGNQKTEDPVYNPLEELKKFIHEEEENDFHEPEIIPPNVYDPEKELLKYIGNKESEDENVKKTEDVSAEDQSSSGLEESNTEHGFLAWLDNLEGGSKSTPEEEKLTVTEPKPISVQASEKKSKDDPQKLLDEFIRNRPSIRRMRKDFYNPQDMAKKSDKPLEGLVTETLAKLHLKQGRPENAIEIYEQLKLQNPKNIAYFAARIQEIRNQIEKEND